MLFRPLKIFALALVLLTLAASAARAADSAPLTRQDVEGIVRDYIAAHPEDILTAVQKHQEKTVSDRQAAAVKTNHQGLYNDPLTPVVGNPNGDVTVVEFFDYNCGYCKKVLPQILRLIEEDKGVRVLFKEFPILGPSSESAAKWALAAQKQKKYFEFHKALMQNHDPITDALLEKIAGEAGLDVAAAKNDAQGTEILMQIERNRDLAANMGLRGTPAFIIGDEVSPGVVNYAAMVKGIAKVRATKNDAPASDKK